VEVKIIKIENENEKYQKYPLLLPTTAHPYQVDAKESC
jgi:hypothetical protein